MHAAPGPVVDAAAPPPPSAAEHRGETRPRAPARGAGRGARGVGDDALVVPRTRREQPHGSRPPPAAATSCGPTWASDSPERGPVCRRRGPRAPPRPSAAPGGRGLVCEPPDVSQGRTNGAEASGARRAGSRRVNGGTVGWGHAGGPSRPPAACPTATRCGGTPPWPQHDCNGRLRGQIRSPAQVHPAKGVGRRILRRVTSPGDAPAPPHRRGRRRLPQSPQRPAAHDGPTTLLLGQPPAIMQH